MKKIFVSLAATAILVTPLAFAMPAGAVAASTWNVTGHYVAAFVLGGSFSHDMNLAQDSGGNVTGDGGNPAGGPYAYHWNITSGSVVGDQISLTALYDLGAPGTIMHITGTIAADGTMSGVWDDNFGGTRTGTWSTTSGAAVLLSAQDFGVVNYDTGLGILKGYTAGFGLTNATFAGAQSVVVRLYAGTTLLQTNTATAQLGATITGNQISSPFDVSGSFQYGTDGYWTNVRETQYGQSVAATRVVATVTLANGAVVTAENTVLTGDPTTIYPLMAPVITAPANGATVTTSALVKIDWMDVTGLNSPFIYQYQAYSDAAYTGLIYDSGMALTASEIATPGTPPGIYYVRVRAQDALGSQSSWSNGAGNAYTITVIADGPVIATPTSKDQCKNDGWKTFNGPEFKNQGDCVSFVASNGKANGNP